MGKYSSSAHRPEQPQRNRIPAGVRGIGCGLMGVMPVFSWALADFLVTGPGRNWRLPPEWLGYPKIPPLLLRIQSLNGVWTFLQNQGALTAKIIFFLGIMVILSGLLAVVYGYIYRVFGPSQYGPQDVPPPNIRTKKYRR